MKKIMADSKLEKMLARGNLELSPRIEKEQIRPASIDLRVGKIYDAIYHRERHAYYPGNEVGKDADGVYHLKAGRHYCVETLEKVDFKGGADSFYVIPRSSFGRSLVSVGLLEENLHNSGGVRHAVSDASEYEEKREDSTIKPGYSGKIALSLSSASFGVDLKKGDRIVQLVGIEGEGEGGNTYSMHIGKFLGSLLGKTVKPANGVKDDTLFTDMYLESLVASEKTAVKCQTKETVNYSDDMRAAIVLCYSKGRALDSDRSVNVSYVDPGYSGRLFGMLSGDGVPEVVRTGDRLLYVKEYKVSGIVKRSYADKKTGSHY